MKNLYSLLLIAIGSFAFGQTFYSENMGIPTANTLIPAYATGTAPATFQNSSPIIYTGTGDVRTSVPSTGYSGASGGGNVFLTAATPGTYFQIDGLNTSAYSTADLQLSFGYLINNITTQPQMVLEKSVDNGTTWTPIAFPNNTTTTWNLVTIGGSQIPSAPSLSLRFTQPAGAQVRIDDVKLSSVSASCTFAFGTEVATCDAITSALDTYNITIPYTGAGNATYSVTTTSGTISGDNPTTVAAGNIIITGITEGTSVTVTVTGGTCNTSKEVTSPACKPVNPLPYSEHFEYAAGASLGDQQMWANVNSGDAITIVPGNLTYPGVAAFGNSAAFSGSGIDATTPFTPVTSGTIYASFLMNVTDLTTMTSVTPETYFATLTEPNAGAFRARLFLKKTDAQYQLGFANAGTTTTNYSPTLYNVGDVVMVVMGYDYATNTLKLWLNPDLATFNDATATTLTDIPATAITTIGGFLLRQDGNTTTPSITVDALRIATSIGELLGVAQNDIAGLKVYPNPVSNGNLYIATDSNDTKSVAIFDVLGKKVIETSVNEQPVNVSGLTTGVYIVKITEAGKTATRKLVIK